MANEFTFTVESDTGSNVTEGEMILGDIVRANFSYSLSDPTTASIIVTEYSAKLDLTSAWKEERGGGFALELSFSNFDESLIKGTYVKYFNDGTLETGIWESSDVRDSPLIFLTK